MIGLETEEDSATVVLENRRFDVRVNGDEAGNDGAAAHRCTIVRFEFTLTEFLKSHIHVCPHVLTSIQRDVCSLSILIVFFFFLSILCIPLDVHPFRTIYFDIRILYREKRMKQLYYYQVFRFSISTIPWFAFVKSDSYDFFLQQFSRFIFPLLIPLWHETQQFHKIEEGTFFREGEIWLIVDPGLGPRRFHVIVREGGKTWIRGGLFFFLLHAHTHTNAHTNVKWSDDEWMTGQWARSDARERFMTIQYVDGKRSALWMHPKYLISNFSPWFILLLGSASIKGRIHLHSETIVCDHRLRPPTRA